MSAVIGVLGGVILVMSWWRFGSVMACIVVVGLMLGFLVASTVLFTPLGKRRKLSIRSAYIIHTHTHTQYPTCVPVISPQGTWTCSGVQTWFSG